MSEATLKGKAWVAYYDGVCKAISVAEFTTAHEIAEWFKNGAQKIELLPKEEAKELFFSGMREPQS